MGTVIAPKSVAGELLATYRDLVPAEARLAEALATRGEQLRPSLVDQWGTLSDYVHLYASGLSPAGALVLAGMPDEASRFTGIPFTSPARARDVLGLTSTGAEQRSPGEDAFWGAVTMASTANADAPLESLFGTVHLAHALPFQAPATAGPVLVESAQHVLRLLSLTRPQLVVTIGPEAMRVLARATGDARVRDVAELDESVWCDRWSGATKMHECPYVDVPSKPPFRARLLPVASLEGEHAAHASDVLAGALARMWAA